jgi:hypothetical protein
MADVSDHRVRKESPVTGDRALIVCSKCGRYTVLRVHRHDQIVVMFCTSCERSWLAPAD